MDWIDVNWIGLDLDSLGGFSRGDSQGGFSRGILKVDSQGGFSQERPGASLGVGRAGDLRR